MNLNQKLVYLKQHIDGIVDHTDEDAGVRLEALKMTEVLIADGCAKIQQELDAKKAALQVPPSKPADA